MGRGYKANAIRTLRLITEPNMLGPAERYLCVVLCCFVYVLCLVYGV